MQTLKKPTYGEEDILIEPYCYLLQVKGKQIRSKLIDAFDKWMKIPGEVKEEIKHIVQMLHTSSLLIDDIEDNSELRRGIPTAHKVYGIPNCLNSANYIYFRALERTHKLKNPKAVEGFLDEMINLHKGQGYDIWWRDSISCPTIEEYEQMVIDKTGGLFRLAVKVMQAFSEDKRDYVPLVNKMGLLFQVQDDYMNLQSDEYTQNKSFCEDLTEGKFSFPVIHGIRSNPGDNRLINIVKQRTESVSLKEYALKYLESAGSFEYTLKRIEQLYQEIEKMIEEFGGNGDLTVIVSQLVGHVKLQKPKKETNRVDLKLSSDVIN